VGLEDTHWSIYSANTGSLQLIDNIDSPRTVAYHHTTQQLAYIGADSTLKMRSITSGTERKITGNNPKSRFTQPHFSNDGRSLYVVELPEGKSRRTNIIRFDLESGEVHGIVRKRTAQFEPNTDHGEYLYYTTAICVDDCEGMIWELWRRNLIDGRQHQLTLMNALANQPHISTDNWLYFTSNADGGRFHIWRMRPEPGATPIQITRGNVRDSDPVTDTHGDLYFLRKTSTETRLMHWTAGQLTTVDTGSLRDMRNLEMGR